jgi:hypothetical protein
MLFPEQNPQGRNKNRQAGLRLNDTLPAGIDRKEF